MFDDVEEYQQEAHLGVTISRDGDAIVVRIPVRFHRRNGRQMVLAHGGNKGEGEQEQESKTQRKGIPLSSIGSETRSKRAKAFSSAIRGRRG